jgi:zinc D-Ala-D-Ala carboxypeptidase
MNLTKNFTLAEMTKSETALRHDLENTPNEQEISAMKLLAEKVLQPVRDHFGKGVKVNSGFGIPDVNQKGWWITQLGPYTGAGRRHRNPWYPQR